ncbi:MAG: PP2C family protein-serine/threonine phosphatase [Planctomycetota bacterium]|nr:PP2C family protein-serine/threonine phosphatase [Planctomycetota bacterium]
MTSTLTMDFREEYEAERSRWLRRRVRWFAGVSLAIFGVDLLGSLLTVIMSAAGAWEPLGMPARLVALELASNVMSIVVLVAVLARVGRSPLSVEAVDRIIFWTIVLIGLANILPTAAAAMTLPGAEAGVEAPPAAPSVSPLMSVLFVHVLAALFISWTPREAIRPLVPLLVVSAVITLVFSPASLPVRLTFILLSPLVGVPGVLIGWWRHGRFRQKFQFQMLRGHYGVMKRELTDARRIHEVLFPPRIDDGPVRFDYRYEPMRQIGGDYLYTALDEPRDAGEARLSVVLIDVTGHGISAALTVNRLHGELERLFGERTDLSPGDTLTALNHYVNVALAKHNVYATALCLRVDPSEETVRWASAGHPPAFLRTAGGLLERLEPTAMMLGAGGDDAFEAGEQSMPLRPGDAVIAYTDGVIEARDQTGRMLTIEGMQAVMAGLPLVTEAPSCADAVMTAVQRHRYGPVQDDTLIVELRRPME